MKQLRAHGQGAIAVNCDVSDAASVERAARFAFDSFGHVDLLFNNAGVSKPGAIEEVPLLDWDWILRVNLYGVIHGIRSFLPAMKRSGREGYIVNTASMSGLIGLPQAGPYCASKFAVVGLTEVLAQELADFNIGVSVLCPSWVRTNILSNGRNRPIQFGGAFNQLDNQADPVVSGKVAKMAHGLTAEYVAEQVLEAMKTSQFYIFTHPERVAAYEQHVRLRVKAAAG